MKKEISKVVLIASTGLLLQSCFVAKDYKRPELKTEETYRSTIVAQDSTTMSDLSWNQVFKDQLLQNYINEGIQNNYDLQIATQNVVAAQSYMKQGKAGYLPNITMGATWTHQEFSKNSQFGRLFNGGLDQYEIGPKISWEADIWGKIRSNKRATNASYLQTIAATQAVQSQIVTNIASVYFQLMSMDAQLKVAEQTMENRTKSIEIIKALKEGGSVNEVGVKQTEAQKYATQIIIEDLKFNINLLENSLSVLLGRNPGKVERNTLDSQVIDAPITSGVPAKLLSNRPDLIAAEYSLINAFEMTNVARSNFYPSLTISGTGGLQSVELKNWFSANSLFANIVTGLSAPLWNQRNIRTQNEVAKSNQQKAFLQYEKTLLTASKEVSDALASYTNETNKLVIREQQVDALKKAASYSDELLNYGMVNYLEVLTAKDNALNSELSLIDNKYKQLNAVIDLYRALGGGWK